MSDVEPSLTIDEFCKLERICRATFYSHQRQGSYRRILVTA
jgi:hypothetical protein